MQLNTPEEFERARERLRQRDSDSLAAFVMSLATDTGPVGDQVRTFIAADELAKAVDSVRNRIRALPVSSEYDHRHSRGRQMGEYLDLIVVSVERWVLPQSPTDAFQLLTALFEADEIAIENCGEYDWEVACAYQRAAQLMAAAAKNLPRPAVEEQVKALLSEDTYGMRAQLASAFATS